MSTTRDLDVIRAIRERSLRKLQELSLRPGGFRDARQQAWTFLLGVEVPTVPERDIFPLQSRRESSISESLCQSSSLSESTSPKGHLDPPLDDDSSHISDDRMHDPSHPDEHQVQLDTNRSFILYPVENHSIKERKSLQDGLQDVILGVLRKRPKLRYFQGYHDIITVLFLTLPLDVVLPCAEKLSLHRLRDSMGHGLDPLVGQLRVLKRLLRLVDPTFAEILERNSPLPYYALSNLLTLFSHDVPTLPLIQHVFDWLLCHEPIAAIWLATAVILHRKQDILALEREGDEAMGMIHAVLSAFPALSEDESSYLDVAPGIFPGDARETSTEKNQINFLKQIYTSQGEAPTEKMTSTTVPTVYTADEKLLLSSDDAGAAIGDGDADVGMRSATTPSLPLDSWTADIPRAISPSVVSIPEHISESASDTAASVGPLAARGIHSDDLEFSESHDEDFMEFTPEIETRPCEDSSSTRSHSPPGAYQEKPPVSPLPLSVLLREASELLVAYPPSSPALRLTETFGLQSALYPCNCSSARLLSDLNDDEADACVDGDNVVLPPTEEEYYEENSPRKSKNADRTLPPRKGKGKGMIRIVQGIVIRRKTLVASAILLLSITVALYGFGPGGRGAIRNGHWRGRYGGESRMFAWMGTLLGVCQKLRNHI